MAPHKRDPKNSEQDRERGEGGEASGQDWEALGEAN
jgi:hypothetical protein